MVSDYTLVVPLTLNSPIVGVIKSTMKSLSLQ